MSQGFRPAYKIHQNRITENFVSFTNGNLQIPK